MPIFGILRWPRAAWLYSASDPLHAIHGVPLPPIGREKVERYLAAPSASLGKVVFDSAWTAGRAMPWEQSVEHALEENV